jgi:hypothetical protein
MVPGVVAGVAAMAVSGRLFGVAPQSVLQESFACLAFKGIGTTAPIPPTRRLVVGGFYYLARYPNP